MKQNTWGLLQAVLPYVLVSPEMYPSNLTLEEHEKLIHLLSDTRSSSFRSNLGADPGGCRLALKQAREHGLDIWA